VRNLLALRDEGFSKYPRIGMSARAAGPAGCASLAAKPGDFTRQLAGAFLGGACLDNCAACFCPGERGIFFREPEPAVNQIG